jgi:hypothetical protein
VALDDPGAHEFVQMEPWLPSPSGELFWLIAPVTLFWLPIHRRPSVTEQSVEGPGTSRRPTQEDEALPPARAGVFQRPGRFLRWGVRHSSVITDDTS